MKIDPAKQGFEVYIQWSFSWPMLLWSRISYYIPSLIPRGFPLWDWFLVAEMRRKKNWALRRSSSEPLPKTNSEGFITNFAMTKTFTQMSYGMA